MKYGNGAVSPYSSPWNSSGTPGARSVRPVTTFWVSNGTRCSDSRSPVIRFPIWSWFWANTTNRSGGTAELSLPCRRPRTGEGFPGRRTRAGTRRRGRWTRPKSRVVAVALAGDERVERVVEVVVPLRVHPEPAVRERCDHPDVVEVRFGDQPSGGRSRAPGASADGLVQLHQERPGGRVDDAVDRVEPQGVDAELLEPHQRVAAEVPADLVAPRPVVVDRLAPRRAVPVREVRAEPVQDVALGPEVVVDDVEDHGHPAFVAPLDEPPQPGRAAVGVMDGVREDAVVAPVPRAGELGHRHQLDRVHADRGEMVEVADQPVERAVRATPCRRAPR